MNAIDVEKLYVAYEHNEIISGMTVAIPKGKVTIIIGSNGCGKSTLLKTIGRIIKPKSGSIFINQKDVRQQQPKEVAKQMAVLPQNPAMPTGLLVKELVAYGRFPYQKAVGGLSKEDLEKISWAIEQTGLTEYAERPLERLSGGQRQRAWIAMALAQDTEILLLDEPTTYLDMSYQLEILQLLQQLNRTQNKTVVMVLHELNNACRFADHIIGVKDGSIVFEGQPNTVITPENLYRIYGIHARMQPSANGEYPVCVEYDF